MTRDRLIDTIWNDREISENNLDVFIRFLRTKVDLAKRRYGFGLAEGS